MDHEAIFHEAAEAAKAAVRANAHLENPHAFDCGFAWVDVKPATHPFIRAVKKLSQAHIEAAKRHAMPGSTAVRRAEGEARSRYGWRKDYGGGGWQFFMPGGSEHNGQSVAVFRAGAKAFAEVLTRHDIPAEVGSRLD